MHQAIAGNLLAIARVVNTPEHHLMQKATLNPKWLLFFPKSREY